jgi:hypothetical protein
MDPRAREKWRNRPTTCAGPGKEKGRREGVQRRSQVNSDTRQEIRPVAATKIFNVNT